MDRVLVNQTILKIVYDQKVINTQAYSKPMTESSVMQILSEYLPEITVSAKSVALAGLPDLVLKGYLEYNFQYVNKWYEITTKGRDVVLGTASMGGEPYPDIRDQNLRRKTESDFYNGDFDKVLQYAGKYLEVEVKTKSGVTDKIGASLMKFVFTPNNPILRHPNTQFQEGLMMKAAAVMSIYRNDGSHNTTCNYDAKFVAFALGEFDNLLVLIDECQLV